MLVRWWPLALIFLGLIKLYDRTVASRSNDPGSARITGGEIIAGRRHDRALELRRCCRHMASVPSAASFPLKSLATPIPSTWMSRPKPCPQTRASPFAAAAATSPSALLMFPKSASPARKMSMPGAKTTLHAAPAPFPLKSFRMATVTKFIPRASAPATLASPSTWRSKSRRKPLSPSETKRATSPSPTWPRPSP